MRLQFSLRSDRDLERLFDFLTQTAPSIRTAEKALTSIKDGAIRLIDNPNVGTEMADETGRREFYIPFGNNNYIIRYKPDFDEKVIRILRIWHSRENR